MWSVENHSTETLSVTITLCLRGYKSTFNFVSWNFDEHWCSLSTYYIYFLITEATSAEPFEVDKSNVNIIGMKIHNIIHSNKCSFAYGARETVSNADLIILECHEVTAV